MMTDNEFEQFITMLDAACASDDPKIKKALKRFMFLIRLNLSDDEMEPGPFSAMLDEMDDLRRRVRDLENAGTKKLYDNTTDYWYGSSATPHWVYTGGTSTAGSSSGTVTVTPSSTSGNTTTTINTGGCTGYIPSSTSSTTWGGIYSGYTINLGDDENGKRIKKELKEKLGMLIR